MVLAHPNIIFQLSKDSFQPLKSQVYQKAHINRLNPKRQNKYRLPSKLSIFILAILILSLAMTLKAHPTRDLKPTATPSSLLVRNLSGQYNYTTNAANATTSDLWPKTPAGKGFLTLCIIMMLLITIFFCILIPPWTAEVLSQ